MGEKGKKQKKKPKEFQKDVQSFCVLSDDRWIPYRMTMERIVKALLDNI